LPYTYTPTYTLPLVGRVGCRCMQSAQREIALWFKAEELASYEPPTCAWLYE